ncbi:ThiF family adenylyltransferase [Aequorivita marina]|uniref:ThiF family adenylyltransferase n=1 Tax=Aequorivita marina TaxID=3073654 RepID=UPI002874602E|nr:ThiF family adenylyltransferase [Aequorivita sp. S2608]MDS1297066.1 ThiF family adenylyltransferase [Aequorivita sp. S2608]
MKLDYTTPKSEKVKIEELKNEKSKQIVSSIDAFGGTINLTEIKKADDKDEFLFLNFLPDIPNNPINDIRQEEAIVIITTGNNQELPKVFALRDDFPVGLSHTNITKDQRPVSLCIHEESFKELRHKWSGSYFLHSIKNWLELTAKDKLHLEDQPLEPFVIGSNGIIIDPNKNYIKELPNGFYTTIGSSLGIPIHRLYITTKPINNGVVHQRIGNLYVLNELFKSKQIDLLGLLKPRIIKLVNDGLTNNINGDYWNGIVFLIVEIPILRNSKNSEPTLAGFKINATLGQLSSIFGRSLVNLNTVFNVDQNLSESRLSSINVEILSPHLALNKALAKNYSGTDKKWSESKFSLIGLGALGSQFFMNLTRSGFGKWNLIDKDILLPHNFIRHASIDIENHIVANKAKAISKQANELLNDHTFSKPIEKDICNVEKSLLLSSDVILDMSTSIGVERYLANEFQAVRKFSLFLNPIGNDLVMLSEDCENYYPLDMLEIQYYKQLLEDSDLSEHLTFNQEGKIRYARGCRDITSKIPQENLAVFSGIASKAFKKKLNDNGASIDLWKIKVSGAVEHYGFLADDWLEEKINDWTIFMNENILKKIFKFRIEKLPNETGGILIGAIDNFYKKVYVTSTILSPEDSIEKPTLFIRGIKGVKEKLEHISKTTNNNLKYLGEWHSHPKNCGLGMSGDDKVQFAELLNEAKLNGHPALMSIFGDSEKYKTYFDNHKI